ncbi:glycosyltransferase [Planktomarina sp.]|nr:glycosyltransferase [Planktomarina sp.]
MSNKLLVYLVYHSETLFIMEAIESVLKARSVSKFDLVVIDTSVCEKASQVLQNVVPSHIKIIPQKGILTKVVSFVFEKYKTHYDYILRLDADDVLLEDGLEKLLNDLEANPRTGAAYGGWQLINQKSTYISHVEAPPAASLQGFHGACTMFRTSALHGLDIEDLGITSQDGFAIFMHLYSSGWEISALPEPIFKYRRHTTNLSSNKKRLWDSRLKILRHYVAAEAVDAIILVDSQLENLGENDYEFVKSAEKFHINDGIFLSENQKDFIDAEISLTQFIFKKFETTNKTIISFNYNKNSSNYFDGLIEYICRLGMLSEARHVQYAQYVDRAIWHFTDTGVSCINKKANMIGEIKSENFFIQNQGLNYFNFSKNIKRNNFVVTNNFFTSSVDLNESFS